VGGVWQVNVRNPEFAFKGEVVESQGGIVALQ